MPAIISIPLIGLVCRYLAEHVGLPRDLFRRDFCVSDLVRFETEALAPLTARYTHPASAASPTRSLAAPLDIDVRWAAAWLKHTLWFTVTQTLFDSIQTRAVAGSEGFYTTP